MFAPDPDTILALVAVDNVPGLQGYAKWLAGRKIALGVSSDGMLLRVGLVSGTKTMVHISAAADAGPGKLGCLIEMLIYNWECMYDM